jgi:hypothetical protein
LSGFNAVRINSMPYLTLSFPINDVDIDRFELKKFLQKQDLIESASTVNGRLFLVVQFSSVNVELDQLIEEVFGVFIVDDLVKWRERADYMEKRLIQNVRRPESLRLGTVH